MKCLDDLQRQADKLAEIAAMAEAEAKLLNLKAAIARTVGEPTEEIEKRKADALRRAGGWKAAADCLHSAIAVHRETCRVMGVDPDWREPEPEPARPKLRVIEGGDAA